MSTTHPRRCSNTSGVFKAYHQGWGGSTHTALYRILAPLTLRPPVLFDNHMRNHVTCVDALQLAPRLGQLLGARPDIVYLDPPYNLFPSVHLAIVTLAALVALKARRVYGAMALVAAGLVAVSIYATKQHFLVDGVAGVMLAVAAYAIFVRTHCSNPGETLAYGWKGPACYAALHAAFTLLLYGAFRAGFAPWE